VNFGVNETEAAGLLGDLKALALPLHGVVLAGHALRRVQIGPCGQAQFAAKAILEYPQRRSTRPLVCGDWAAMKVLPS
jgi:hypothetical protein